MNASEHLENNTKQLETILIAAIKSINPLLYSSSNAGWTGFVSASPQQLCVICKFVKFISADGINAVRRTHLRSKERLTCHR